ncbi:ATP-binding protein [Superficieibacter sp.]|uniref:AAA family ATPase n=1 Tax=Superficieibacter sp. TaxID=2303322 RepID=UPI0028AE0079|nr:ATP-binding protein [Superficieibacter sp.]
MKNAILWYEVKNFGSFGDEGGLVDLTTSKKDRYKDLWQECGGHQVNLITAIMGANASGKTTLLKPLPFLGWLFWNIPARASEPLYINTNKIDNCFSKIRMNFLLDGDEYLYEITANEFLIYEENLFLKNKSKKFIYVFKRKLTNASMNSILRKLSTYESYTKLDDPRIEELHLGVLYEYTEKSDIFPLGEKEALRTPCNTSIISAARRINITLANSIAYSIICFTNIHSTGRRSSTEYNLSDIAMMLDMNSVLFDKLKNQIKKWDLGLHDITINKETRINELGQNKNHYSLNGLHSCENGGQFTLPFFLESAGTQSALIRLYEILNALESGNPCFIDELGDDLHPHMMKPILELFTNKESNPHGSQLVFTCHKPELINYLGKYRIIITEKKNNRSECFRLDDFPSTEARADENLAAKYLAGAFGGVPEL